MTFAGGRRFQLGILRTRGLKLGVVRKPAALIREQVADVGPDRWPRGVQLYSIALTCERVGLD